MNTLIKSKISSRRRRQIVEQYRMKRYSRREICERYQISAPLLHKWNCWYYRHHILRYHSSSVMKPSYQDQKAQIDALKQRLKQLEIAYEEEKLKRQVFEIMIDEAEKSLEIPIRKKFGAKQFWKHGGNTP